MSRFLFVRSFLLLILIFSLFTDASAQKKGCTDKLARNYNAEATVNDGTCIYEQASVSPLVSVDLSDRVSETSGLTFWDNKLWTHNDSRVNMIYSMDTASGEILYSKRLKGTINEDWEEVAQDSAYLYLGDFGNNTNGNRKDLRIFLISKEHLLKDSVVVDTIQFAYSGQKDFSPLGYNKGDFDCEAFVVSDSIYLFTKQWEGKQTSVYVLPKSPGNYTARFKQKFDVQGLISGADWTEDQNVLVLCGYSGLLQPFLYLLYDFNGTDFFSGNKRKIELSLPFYQVEGIATSDGLKYYLTNENFEKKPLIHSSQQLHVVDMAPYLQDFLISKERKGKQY